jgi:hypothetical protein
MQIAAANSGHALAPRIDLAPLGSQIVPAGSSLERRLHLRVVLAVSFAVLVDHKSVRRVRHTRAA